MKKLTLLSFSLILNMFFLSFTYGNVDHKIIKNKKGVCAERVSGGPMACVNISGTKNCNSDSDCVPAYF